MDENAPGFFDPNLDPNAPPEGVDPAQWAQYVAMQQILAGSTYGDEMGMLEKQRATAEALRYQDSPEGRQAGRVYVAASPFEHLGKGIQQYKAQKQLGEYDKRFGELTEAEKARGGAALEGLGYRKPKKSPSLQPGIQDEEQGTGMGFGY